MALLNTADRAAVHAECMRQLGGPISVLKAQIRAVVDAYDSWEETNATSANNAVPTPQRTALTAQQKALIRKLVTAQRHLRA